MVIRNRPRTTLQEQKVYNLSWNAAPQKYKTMNKKNHIPQIVLEKAQHILQIDGSFIKYLGKRKNVSVYYSAVKDADTGFPFVYLFDGKNVEEKTGTEALDISRSFLKD